MRPGRRSGVIALLALLAGSALLAVSATDAWAAFPLAQNGSIAYQGIHEPSLGFEVFSTNPDGSGQQDWTNSPDYEINPSYSPDGRKIVFARAVGDGNTDIWMLNADGSGQIDLTNTPTVGEVSPVFSPDGKRIAYSSNPEAPPSHVYLMKADGSGQHLLTNTSANDHNPDFSPDGSKITFDHCEGVCDIYTIAPNGSGLTNITKTPSVYETDPSFSSDGKRIVFSYSAGSGVRIATMNADGTGLVVSDDNGLDPFSPVFSPDGHLIAFGGALPSNTGDIYTVKVDGSGLTNVTNTPSPLREEVPAWQSIFTCGGRQATIVGSDAGEKLKGTKGADVIVANGGNDRIKGLGGNDRICGGAGRDRIAGGTGSRDVCKGQAGKDFGGKGCEKGKL